MRTGIKGENMKTLSWAEAPLYIRITQAPKYLSMTQKMFDAHIRPYLTVFYLGPQTKAVLRDELEAVAKKIAQENAEEVRQCHPDYTKISVHPIGKLRSDTGEGSFEDQLAQLTKR